MGKKRTMMVLENLLCPPVVPPTSPPITVLVIDDHVSFAEALRHALDAEDDISVVAIATDSAEAERAVSRDHPVIALVDHRIGNEDGVALARSLQRSAPDMKLIMLTATGDDSTIIDALDAGCTGYLTKDSSLETIITGIRAASHGDAVVPPSVLARLLPRLRDRDMGAGRAGALTSRELDVLNLLSRGRSNAVIAGELLISVNTVRNHIQSILSKLGAHSKLEAVAVAREAGLLGTTSRY